jgi:hypothetical protein
MPTTTPDGDYIEKAGRALMLVRRESPACCRRHANPLDPQNLS